MNAISWEEWQKEQELLRNSKVVDEKLPGEEMTFPRPHKSPRRVGNPNTQEHEAEEYTD